MGTKLQAQNPHSKRLKELIEMVSYRHSSWQVFSDFVEMAAISLSNSVDWVHKEKREARYLEIINSYNKEQELFPKMFAALIESLDYELETTGPTDVLGELFHELNLHNKWKAQYFTPMNICEMIGDMTIGNYIRQIIKEKGFITVSEPAAGSGAMVLGFCRSMLKQNLNYNKQLVVAAADIDLKCVHMAYIQLSLYGIPAVVIHGNSLTLEEWSRWYTPFYILDGWVWRQKIGMLDKRYPEDECIKSMEDPIYRALHNAVGTHPNKETLIQDRITV